MNSFPLCDTKSALLTFATVQSLVIPQAPPPDNQFSADTTWLMKCKNTDYW